MSRIPANEASGYSKSEAAGDYGLARHVANSLGELLMKLPLIVDRRKLEDLVRMLNGGVSDLAMKLTRHPAFSARLAEVGGAASGKTDIFVHYPVEGDEPAPHILHAACIVATFTGAPVVAALSGVDRQIFPGVAPASAIEQYAQARPYNPLTNPMYARLHPWQ